MAALQDPAGLQAVVTGVVGQGAAGGRREQQRCQQQGARQAREGPRQAREGAAERG